MSLPGRFRREAVAPSSQDRFPRALVKGPGFHDPERLPSSGAPSRRACALPRESRRRPCGFATASRLPTSCEPFPICTEISSTHPRRRARHPVTRCVRHRLSTSAINTVSEHDHVTIEIPTRLAGSCPPTGRENGPPCALRPKVSRGATTQGPRRPKPRRRVRRERVAWRATPSHSGSDTSCRKLVILPAGVAEQEIPL
jgi:hypothetical protein